MAPDPLPEPLPPDPLPTVGRWLDEAASAGIPNPMAMALATRTLSGDPNVRFVLCRGFDAQRGSLTFYTDRSSIKGAELAAHARAALAFYWQPLERQLRVRGRIERAPDADSDAYFASRPGGAQVSATVSRQSQPLASRSELIAAQTRLAQEHGVSLESPAAAALERPERWGGYQLWAEEIELWVSMPNRLHDRALYTRTLPPHPGDTFPPSPWKSHRLQP